MRTSDENGIDKVLSQGITRTKGLEAHLLVFRKIETGVEQLETGDTARSKDLLQLAYIAGENKFGLIFSIDGRKVVTYHFPEKDWRYLEHAPDLTGPEKVSLPRSYELDDAPDYERFFFVSSEQPIELDQVLLGLEKLLSSPVENIKTDLLSLSSEIHQDTFLLNKE
jgi:hypothetical protein